MVQDELLGFRDGQTLVAEGGVGLEAKGGSKGSVMVFGLLSGRVVAVMVGGWFLWVIIWCCLCGGTEPEAAVTGGDEGHILSLDGL
jgi:hypothetical protein